MKCEWKHIFTEDRDFSECHATPLHLLLPAKVAKCENRTLRLDGWHGCTLSIVCRSILLTIAPFILNCHRPQHTAIFMMHTEAVMRFECFFGTA